VHRELHIDGEVVRLTAKEFDVLSFLAQHAGKTCTREMILAAVWGTGTDAKPVPPRLRARLRQKLQDPAAGCYAPRRGGLLLDPDASRRPPELKPPTPTGSLSAGGSSWPEENCGISGRRPGLAKPTQCSTRGADP